MAIRALPATAWRPESEDAHAVRHWAEVPYVPGDGAATEDRPEPPRHLAVRITRKQGELCADGGAAKHFAVVTNRPDPPDGSGRDLFARAAADPGLARLFELEGAARGFDWLALTLLAMTAVVCLPRQFQVTVTENADERHLDRAIWLFPLYLLAINLFVLPIALAGRLLVPEPASPDLFVLTAPITAGADGLALLAFIGGLSAATGMVIVETVALATMTSNDLVLPLLLRRLDLARRPDPSRAAERSGGPWVILL